MEAWQEYLASITGKQHLWVAEIFLVTLVTLVAAVLVSRFITKLSERSKSTKNVWDDAVFDALSKPARSMVWLVGFTYAAQIAAGQTESAIFEVVPSIRRIGTIAIFTWFLVSLVKRVETNLMSEGYSHKPMDPTTAMALGKLLRISVIVTALLVALQSLGYSISGVLAFGGIGGIAVGFAAKDLLANFFGGLMVYLDRPFRVGDWVRSPDKNIEGTVEDIGWRLTRIRTFDKRPLYVPNATFAQISVENPSRMTNRRIKETIGVRYDDAAKMDAIISAVKNMIETHPDIDTSQTIIVNFNKFAPSSLDFFIYCFTKTTNWAEYHQIKQDVMLRIIQIIEGLEAECAFPTSTLHIPNPVITHIENA